ncbi:MAG TPA: methyltransferase domain-containing protein [Candidatus Angelobacter sp.]|nr:methyltransferase domain-containing protein [Candidatus Angelobacter sp.]
MKLHLGCGKKHIPGFVHVDLEDQPHIDFRIPVNQLTFAADNSVELIYASHVLEHFGRHEVDQVLREWFRVLCKGGILRLAVPDFEAVVSRYQETQELGELIGLVCGGQRNEYDYHKMVFDEKLLVGRLRDAGFSSVSRYDWRATEHAWMDDYSQAYLPHMDKEKGRLMSLNLEAVK